MAVELIGYSFPSRMEDHAVEEAASAGLQSVEKLIRLLSQNQQQNQPFQEEKSSNPKSSADIEMDCKAVADIAVTKFKKVISLLDRSRTGHARFRRAPLPSSPTQQQQQETQKPSDLHQSAEDKQVSGSKIYHPTPIQRLPPLPHNHHHKSLERRESTATINFSSSPANSFISSLTGDTDSIQPSLSSAFQLTSSAGRPPLSSSLLKRKCSSMDDAAIKCGGSAGRCHCSKKR